MWTLRLAPQRCSPMRAGGGGCLLPRGPGWGGRTAPFHHRCRHPHHSADRGAVALPAGHHPGGTAPRCCDPELRTFLPSSPALFLCPARCTHRPPENRLRSCAAPPKTPAPDRCDLVHFRGTRTRAGGKLPMGAKTAVAAARTRQVRPRRHAVFLGRFRSSPGMPIRQDCLPLTSLRIPPHGGPLSYGKQDRIRSCRMNQRRPTHANDIRRSIRTPYASYACLFP